jgi:anti-anti-sigma factor
MTTPLEIDALSDGPGLRVAGELDASNVSDLALRLEDLVAGDNITLDLTGLVFIDSAGMNALITVARNLGEGSRMTMRVLTEGPVRRVIDLMGIADVLDTVVLVEAEADG